MIYLISDLHLEESRPDITGAFLSFLDEIQARASALYILGDFFETWIGDDENTPLQQQIRLRLKAFSSSGISLYIMHGNRDFLIGEQFCRETGATLLEDPSIVDLYGQRVLLMHGDSLCTRDTAYMKFRQTIRNPAFLTTFLQRPLDERRTTARQLREMSQAGNKGKSMEIMDVTPEEVPKVMMQHQVKTLIHGHTHRPAVHDVALDNKQGRRIVLGDWDREIWFLQVDREGETSLQHSPFPS